MIGPLRRWRTFVVVAGLFLLAFWALVRKDPALVQRYRRPHAAHDAAAGPVAAAPAPKVPPPPPRPEGEDPAVAQLRLAKLPDRYPVASLKALPTPPPRPPAGRDDDGAPPVVPAIQKRPAPAESAEARAERQARRAAVRAAFVHSWDAYKAHAWLADELQPVSGTPRQDYDKLGGWAATLVDTLDTLWIVGLHDEFRMAAAAVADLDFGRTAADSVHVFETTIRYLGGLLGAYEISGGAFPALLRKATELGTILLGAFDTPNRLPMARWDWRAYARGALQTSAPHRMLSAELGTLSLEFTKLTQLTGDARFYDAVQRIADVLAAHQQRTRLPGLWPVVVDAAQPAFDEDATFTLNGRADSLYEYLPKQWLLLGGALDQPRRMYEQVLAAAKKHLFRRVANPDGRRLVLPGEARVADDPLAGRTVVTVPRAEHLGCFVGGMVALAARAFAGPDFANNARAQDDLDLAAQLTDACVWAYNATATGIGPEKFYFDACGAPLEAQDGLRCTFADHRWRAAVRAHFKEKGWATLWMQEKQEPPLTRRDDDDAVARLLASDRLPPGMLEIDNPHYLLRPEAIESVFVLWRLTGDRAWQDKAWHMFQQVARYTGAAPPPPSAGSGPGPVAAAAVEDVTRTDADAPLMDRMESFWLAETLKYFYLVFDDFDVLSLDDWVFNTEAHPLRRAK